MHDPSHRFVAAGMFERAVLADKALRAEGFVTDRHHGAHISRASLRAELKVGRATPNETLSPRHPRPNPNLNPRPYPYPYP